MLSMSSALVSDIFVKCFVSVILLTKGTKQIPSRNNLIVDGIKTSSKYAKYSEKLLHEAAKVDQVTSDDEEVEDKESFVGGEGNEEVEDHSNITLRGWGKK